MIDTMERDQCPVCGGVLLLVNDGGEDYLVCETCDYRLNLWSEDDDDEDDPDWMDWRE